MTERADNGPRPGRALNESVQRSRAPQAHSGCAPHPADTLLRIIQATLWSRSAVYPGHGRHAHPGSGSGCRTLFSRRRFPATAYRAKPSDYRPATFRGGYARHLARVLRLQSVLCDRCPARANEAGRSSARCGCMRIPTEVRGFLAPPGPKSIIVTI